MPIPSRVLSCYLLNARNNRTNWKFYMSFKQLLRTKVKPTCVVYKQSQCSLHRWLAIQPVLSCQWFLSVQTHCMLSTQATPQASDSSKMAYLEIYMCSKLAETQWGRFCQLTMHYFTDWNKSSCFNARQIFKSTAMRCHFHLFHNSEIPCSLFCCCFFLPDRFEDPTPMTSKKASKNFDSLITSDTQSPSILLLLHLQAIWKLAIWP